MALKGDFISKPAGYVLGVIGVDPGANSGYGLLRVESLAKPDVLAYGHVRGDDGKAIGLVLSTMVTEAKAAGLDDLVMVCEQQFVKDARSMDKKVRIGQQRGALSVATSKGRWMGLAEERGITTGAEAHPTTWREAMLGSGWGRKPRKQCKDQALAVALSLWGVKLLKTHDHTAEALLIGAYHAKELFLERMKKLNG